MNFLDNMVKTSNAMLKDKLQNPFNIGSNKQTTNATSVNQQATAGDQPTTDVNPTSSQEPESNPSATTSNNANQQSSNITNSNSSNPQEGDHQQPRSSFSGDGSQFAAIAADAEAVTKKAVDGAKNIGTFLFSMANKAGKHVTDTAKQVKKVVENTNIMTDFTREQQEFIKEHGGNVQLGELPWSCYPDDEVKANEMKEQILSLSQDKRNFVRAPPSDSNFDYNPEICFPIALALLKEDPNLGKMRYELVPKFVNEDTFWRNYFYRVSLLKQFVDKGDSLAKHDWLSSRSSSGEGPDEITLNDDSVTQTHSTNDTSSNRQVLDNDTTTSQQQTFLHKQDSQGTTSFLNQVSASQTTPTPSATSQYQELDESSKLLAEADDLNSKLKELNISFDDDGTQDDQEKWEKELEKDLQEFELISNDLSTLADEKSLEKEIMELKKKSLASAARPAN